MPDAQLQLATGKDLTFRHARMFRNATPQTGHLDRAEFFGDDGSNPGMSARITAPFGTWASPISAQRVASGVKPFSAPRFDGSATQLDLVSGFDFFAAPCLSTDSRQMAWLCWNHPAIPWNGTELWLAGVNANDSLTNFRKVCGSSKESICQPAWSPANVLPVVSDRSGWGGISSG